MNQESKATIQLKHRFSASAARVYDAWLDPETAGKWLFSTPAGQMVHVSIDPRIGGGFRFVDRRDGVDIDHIGEYAELVRPTRLVFRFQVPKFSLEWTTVTVDIEPLDQGCELTLTHDGVLESYLQATREGWTKILSGLDASLTA